MALPVHGTVGTLKGVSSKLVNGGGFTGLYYNNHLVGCVVSISYWLLLVFKY